MNIVTHKKTLYIYIYMCVFKYFIYIENIGIQYNLYICPIGYATLEYHIISYPIEIIF